MLIDLDVAGREALIIGGGKEAEFKALKLLDGRARVTVVAKGFTHGLRELASSNKRRVRLVSSEPTLSEVRKMIEEGEPRVIFISTGDPELDEATSKVARASGKRNALVCVVDCPELNDFNMPAIARRGDISVGVSTGGRSPAMAGILRRRIERVIAPEDILQVRLQGEIRKASRKVLKDALSRKEFAYKVIRDPRVGALLRKNDYAGAKRRAERMLEEASGGA